MKIPSSVDPRTDRPERIERARSSPAEQAKAKSRGEAAQSTAGPGVRATVSARARSLAQEMGIDVGKVSRLREAIENGSFQMDFQLIAERILERG